MAKVTFKNNTPSWELDEEEKKVWEKVSSSKYSKEDNEVLINTTNAQAKSIVDRLNSTEFKDTKTRVQLQKDLYSFQNNLKRLRSRGYDTATAEENFKTLQSYADLQSVTFSPFKTKDEYKDYEAKTTFDLEKGKEEIAGLEGILAKAKELSKTPTTYTRNGVSYTVDSKGNYAPVKTPNQSTATRGGVSYTKDSKGNYVLASKKENPELDKLLKEYGYSSIEDLEADISNKRAYLKQAEHIQSGIKLTNDALNAEDFSIYNVPNTDFAEDRTYKYINDIDGFRASEDSYWLEHGTITNDSGFVLPTVKPAYINANFEYMTDKEKGIFNYYYFKFGKDKAYEYLNNLEQTLNKKSAVKIRGQNDTDFERMLFAAVAGVDQFASGMENLFNTKDDYITPSDTQIASGMIREDLEDSGFKILGSSVGQIGYDLINTTSNMLPSILTSTVVGWVNPAAGAVVGAGLMGASASGNAYAEMLNLGYDKGQARGYSLLVGASEATLQYLLGGIGKLGGSATKNLTSKIATKLASKVDKAIAKIAINTGTKLVGNAVSEFGEEYLQEVLTPVFKNFALNTNEDVKFFTTEALYSGILGALSAGILEGGSTVVGEVGTYKSGKNIIEKGIAGDLADLGKTYSKDTEAFKLASNVNENTDAYTIGQLLDELGGESLASSNVAEIEKSLIRKDVAPEDARSIAKWIYKASQGEILSKSKLSAIYDNPLIVQTLKEVAMNPKSTVNQRIAEYTDILDRLENGNAKKAIVSTDGKEESPQETSAPYSPEYVAALAKEFEAMGIPAEIAESMAIAQLSTPTVNSVPTVENIAESKYEVSADGKTINKTSGEIVNVQKIDSISKDGEAKLKTNDGMVVNASELSFGTDAEALFVENIGNIKIGKNPISTTSANYLYMTAMDVLKDNPEMTADEAMSLIKGLTESYIYGVYNLGRSKLTTRNEDGSATLFAGELTREQRKYAYELGTKDSVSKAEADQKVIDELVEKAKPKTSKKSIGKVIFEKGANVDESTLTKTQKANLEGIKLLAKLSSIEFHIYRSDKVGNDFKYTMSDGTETSANGWFVVGTNEIWVDLNAGNSGEGTMIRTAAHEISHYIKVWSPLKWEAMANLLMGEFSKNGVDTESMLREQIDKIKRRYKADNETIPSETELLDEAYEELVCDALSDMLTDGSIVNFIAEVKAKDRNLGQKILDAIKSLLKKWGLIIDDYKGRELDTAEAQALSQLEDTFKKLQEMYREAFMDANEVVAKLANSAKSEAKKSQKNTTIEGDVKLADRQHYWVSGFSHNEMSYVERIAKHEVELTNNYIDIENKWLYNNRKDKPYFALYSTAHIDNPTVMYASKGSKATKEYKWFMDFIAEMEMTKNGRDDLRRKTINEVLISLGYALDKGGLYSRKPTRARNNRNVGVYSGTPGFKPSEALLNCIKNIGEKQEQSEQRGVVRYSDRDTDTAGGNEHLRPGDKGKSEQQKVNFSLRKDIDQNKIKRAYSLARSRDSRLIAEAEEYESKNKSRLYIYNKTGLVRDPKGIWLYELDDRKMKFYLKGDAWKKNDPNYQEYLKYEKIVNSYPKLDLDENGDIILTDEQAKVYDRYCDLIEILENRYGSIHTLKDYVVYDELFEKYPQIGDAGFIICNFRESGKLGAYDPELNVIEISRELYKGKIEKRTLEDTIVHEIQHAIQTFDERQNGSNTEYWNARLARDGYLPYSDWYERELTPFEAYYLTAGEIEAREVEQRRKNGQVKDPKILPYLFWDYALYPDEEIDPPEQNEAKYSTRKSEYTDSDYLAAVEKGDVESLQHMVDAAAQNAGYTERLYHQTGADFNEFNTKNQKAGKFDHELPEGIFLKPSDKDIGLSGKKQMELFAKIQNPLLFGTRHVAAEYWKRNILGYADVSREIASIDRTYSAKITQAEREMREYTSEWKKSHPKTPSSELYKDTEFQRLFDLQDSITDEWESKSDEASLRAKQLINDFVSKSEYDGIVIDLDQGSGGRFTKTYIVYDSSQLKTAAPVTYDNEGNVIALSERFNSDKKDIRYSDRDNLVISNEDYSKLLSKKAINVSKEIKAKIDTQRIRRYGDAVSEDIPILDVFRLADYNKVNVAYKYVIRNVSKDYFTVIKKQLIKPQAIPKELNKLIQEEMENAKVNAELNKRTGELRNRQHNNPLSDNVISNERRLSDREQLQENDTLATGSKQSYEERYSGQGIYNFGRGVKLSQIDSKESYSESQYNNFGWVRANDILTASEYNTLLSRYADYKHNKDIYPTTRFGEGVIHSFDYPKVFIYAKGTIKNPQITKIVRITEDNSELVRIIREEILKYEYQQVPLPYENVQLIFGEGILNISRKRDCIPFQEYKRQQERGFGKTDNYVDRIEQERARNPEKSAKIDKKHQIKRDDRDPNSSNRAILVNALEGTAQNDIEKKKLAEYKEKILLIESEEQRLSEIQKQLFTKGGIDPAQRNRFQFEAKQIANRINTYDRQLLNLEATTALKNVLNREKALAMKRQKQKDNEYLKQYKEKVAKDTKELIARNQESRKRVIESREKTAMRHKIKTVVNDLNNLLLKPTKERHVPEEMRIAVSEALSIVNMDTVDADTRVAKYNDLIAKAKDPDVIASLSESRDRILEQGNKLADKLTKLKDAYGMVRDSADDSVRSMYDDVIYNKIESVQRTVGKTPLRNMTLAQLESVYDLYKMVLTTIRDSNKAFAENITMTRLALGSNTFGEIKDNNKTRDTIKHPSTEKFLWQNLKPMQAMKKIGSGTLQKLWNNILYGQETFAQDYDEAVKFAKEMKEKYGYKKWNLDKLYSFESKSGKVMKINLEQMMSIYAYSKRAQADEHIEYGGIVLNEGVIKVKNKLGKTVEVKVNDSTAYRLDKMQIAKIVSTLEKEFPGAKAFVDEMQKYLSETMGEKGNEVSMKMYGIKLFKEEHYFPLKSSKDFMEAANTKLKGDVKIKNKGMTKSTVEHARNPIVLENFLDVWGNHINEMALYHGLVLPLEDFSRTLNYSFKADESLNTDAESVRTALHDAFGDNADNYLNELLKAINGGVLHDSSAQFADKMISKFKKAKVMASLSVIVQQPTAIVRAMGIIEPKYFVAQNFHHKATWEELKKYCPTAIIKETGSFDTNMGRTIVDMVKDERGFTDKVGDFLGKAPAYMDEVGWNMIWRALKNKVATEQKLSGEALLQECGKQMTLIINETQVYDSVMSRNELMRSKNALTKMATAFMAEPSTVANMIYGAGLDFKRGKKGVASKTVAAVISSVVINGLVSALVYAARDDDEDETFLEKYLFSATTEVLDGLNPLTYIPFVKDAYSLFQGYKVERTDMALIKDVVDAVNTFYNVLNPEAYEDMNRKEIAKHIYDNSVPLLTSICDMFGLPVGNILRDAKAIINNDNVPMSQTSSSGIGYAFKDGAMSTLPQFVQKIIGTDSKQDKLYDAIVNGDTAYIERLKSGYKDDKAYETAVRKALRENDSRIREAAEARIGGDIAKYTRIVREIKAEGFFSQDTIVASVNAEINALNKGEDANKASDTDKVGSIYNMDDYYASIVGGDQATAYVVKEDLIKTDVENGKDRDEAEDSFNSRFASYIREQYEDGHISEQEAQRMLVNYGDKSEEVADSKVQYWTFKQKYPDYDDLSEEAVTKYYEDVEPYGIGIDVYYDYSKQKSKCKGTDNNGDGKTDSGSKKAEILQVIDSLPISRSQKDVLYYLNGWSARTIYEAPWH